jgi:hypothetical protein
VVTDLAIEGKRAGPKWGSGIGGTIIRGVSDVYRKLDGCRFNRACSDVSRSVRSVETSSVRDWTIVKSVPIVIRGSPVGRRGSTAFPFPLPLPARIRRLELDEDTSD